MQWMIFPAAIMANTFAMMLVMIGLSLFGKPALAADFGLVHGATVALFYSLSGNARSLILGPDGRTHCPRVLRLRLLLVVPLAALAWVLSIGVVDGGGLFVFVLVLRRAAEWLAEIFLSEHEVQRNVRSAFNFIAVQSLFSVLILIALLKGDGWALPMTVLWSLSPLLACRQRSLLRHALKGDGALLENVRLMLPHFGSTAVIGVSVYMFRLFLLFVAGKAVAGDLFSAFALGGILGAVFSQALGPSMVREIQSGSGPSRLVRVFNGLLIALLVLGAALAALLWSLPGILDWTGKDSFFWYAVACSLLGGVVMVAAQRIRLQIIQGGEKGDVFGSDILANIVLVASVPFLYFGVGEAALVTLYLVSGLLSLFFYASERSGLYNDGNTRWLPERVRLVLLAFMLMLPVFFQFSGGLFVDLSNNFNSGGEFTALPLPASLFACCAGIVLLGRYSDARLALVTLFFLFVGMLFVSLLLEGPDKLILLIQFVVPVFALVLGQQFGRRASALRCLALAGLLVLSVLLPAQLLATWKLGVGYLSPSAYLFSVYQHLQYVPAVLVGVFLISLFGFAGVPRLAPWLVGVGGLMSAYVVYSVSMLAQGFLLAGYLGFAIKQLYERRPLLPIAMAVAMVFGAALALPQVVGTPMAQLKFGIQNPVQPPTDAAPAVDASGVPAKPVRAESKIVFGVSEQQAFDWLPMQNLQERQELWRFYTREVLSGWKPLLLGHAEILDRDRYPSAHNYYLDFVYHFGLIGLVPLLILLIYTLALVIRRLPFIWHRPALLGLSGVVVFFLVVDNLFKVGLRQPYPGILMYFYWGVLLAQLRVPACSLSADAGATERTVYASSTG